MNPWTALPRSAPYVLATDVDPIARFNATARAPFRIELGLMPEPFVGRVDAPIVLLTLNPGVSADDFALHGDEAFRSRVRRCHVQGAMEYPNYYLDPEI